MVSIPVLAANVGIGIDIDVPPPPAQVEVMPAPQPGYIWAPGHWEWQGSTHV